MDHLFIYGPPGSGKSTLGKRLAETLNLPFYDLDEMIVSQAGASIPDIFSSEGEAGFRLRERMALSTVCDSRSGIAALGGGALIDDLNRSKVEAAGPVLCLTASFNTLLARSRSQEGQRPLLKGDTEERLRRLLDQRADHYASFTRQLDTTGLTLDQAQWDAQVRFGRFHVSGMGAGYDVQVVNRGIERLGEALVDRDLKGPIVLVSDSNVGPLYSEQALKSLTTAGHDASSLIMPAGEAHKNIHMVMRLWEDFLEIGLERSSTVVALGGGVVGDLVGFAAATYLRGVPWVAVPTSLLAMVDASLGGKTGADLPLGKNLVGAFHPPSLVWADPRVLHTLPQDEQQNGLAEVVKHGVLADPELFNLCSQGLTALQADWDEVVRRGMAVKVKVIMQDPYERGPRASLNLGHTLGHAIELVSEFKLKHGQAVAIGMVAAARLSERSGIAGNGLADQVESVLKMLGLPTEVPPGLNTDQVLSAMRRDKKRASGSARLVLPVNIGEVRWGVEMPDEALLEVMTRRS